MISKEKLRLSIIYHFTLQILIISFTAFHSPFVAVNIIPFILVNTLIFFLFGFYLFDLKNVKGWWNKKFFEARQRILFKQEVKKEIARQKGLGYDKIER